MNEQILSEEGNGMNQCTYAPLKLDTSSKCLAGFKKDSASRDEDHKGLASVGASPTPLAVRPDGFRVFLDGDRDIDRIRLNEPDPAVVIMAVASRRAQQIARNYALMHAPSLYEKINDATYEITFRFPTEDKKSIDHVSGGN